MIKPSVVGSFPPLNLIPCRKAHNVMYIQSLKAILTQTPKYKVYDLLSPSNFVLLLCYEHDIP